MTRPGALRVKLRGYLALSVLCTSFVMCDLVQRFVIAPWVKLVPSQRKAVLARWQQLMASLVLNSVSKVGGAKIPELPEIPADEGTLILMNHQSVLDIPLVVASLDGASPKIVTRKRYERWIPLISHMVRLYQYPLVDPTANRSESKKMLAGIREAARSSDVPLVIFPEGGRTRDGQIRPFQSTGVKLILRQRRWTVWVVVADGFWQRARFRDFMEGMADIDGRVAVRGPFAWDDPRADAEAFLREIEDTMQQELDELRAATPA